MARLQFRLLLLTLVADYASGMGTCQNSTKGFQKRVVGNTASTTNIDGPRVLQR